MVSDPVASAPFYAALCQQELNTRNLDKLVRDALIVTNGEEPVLELTPDNQLAHPVFKVDTIDTLAAGDCFHGAYLFGRLHGLDIPNCILLAAAASGISTTRPGGCQSFPSLPETQAFLKRQNTRNTLHLSKKIAALTAQE